jgi:hypothetical protein
MKGANFEFYIYHHNDFDGIAASAIFAKFLNIEKRIPFEKIEFNPVDYDLKEEWVDFDLKKPCAVLDFLYHPQSDWWFDHHASTFSGKALSILPYKKQTKQKYWNNRYPSCPSLLVAHFYKFYRKCSIALREIYEDLIKWSDIIDGARYKSPSDLFDYENNYLNISKILSINQEREFFSMVLKAFFFNDLSILLNDKVYRANLKNLIREEKKAINTISKIAEFDEKICFFDQSKYDFPFQRYLAFYLRPNIYYRIGIYRKGDKYSVSVNYNNWKEEKNEVNLGNLCRKLGGGGRHNVGAVLTETHDEASAIAGRLRKLLKYAVPKQRSLFENNKILKPPAKS